MLQLPAMAFSVVSGSLFAWAASRFAVEARHNGELELLLTTPVGIQTFVSDQWTMLKVMLVGPVTLMLLPILWHALARLTMAPDFGPLLSFLYVTNIVLGIGALCWAGMWFGFAARRQLSAILLTVGLVKGIPLLINFLGMLFSAAFSWARSWPGFPFPYFFIQVLILCFYLRVIHEARLGLAGELSHTRVATLMRTFAAFGGIKKL
jgi:hypothetical protein